MPRQARSWLVAGSEMLQIKIKPDVFCISSEITRDVKDCKVKTFCKENKQKLPNFYKAILDVSDFNYYYKTILVNYYKTILDILVSISDRPL